MSCSAPLVPIKIFLQFTGAGTKERLLFVINKGTSFICYQQGDVFYLLSTREVIYLDAST